MRSAFCFASAAPILKTSKVLEENKAMLKSLPAPSQPRAPFQDRGVPMEKGLAGSHPRGKGRQRGRGERHHNNTPQQRRHTLLEMVSSSDSDFMSRPLTVFYVYVTLSCDMALHMEPSCESLNPELQGLA